VAYGYFLWWQSRIEADPGLGLCSGWSTMALRFRRGTDFQTPARYQPGATRAFAIAPVDGTLYKQDVARWQAAQHDQTFKDEMDRAFDRTPAQERAVIKDIVDNAGGGYVAIRQDDSGHAVVVYDYQEFNAPGGTGIRIAIYDPNDPHDTMEETSRATRDAALRASSITIQPDGSWNGASFPWSGSNDKLGVTGALPNADAKLPFSFGIASVFDSGGGGGTPARVTQISTGGSDVLGPDGEPRAGSGVKKRPDLTGAGAVPEYHLDPGREYRMAVTGTGAGRYGHGVIGDGGLAEVLNAPTAPGQTDQVTLRPGAARIGFASAAGGPVGLKLADRSGRATRTATVLLSTTRGGSEEAALGGGLLRLQHNGRPTTATVILGSVGEGLPGTVTTAPIRVGTGERLELRPTRWSALADGVGFTVRTRAGRIVRRGRAKLRASQVVALSGVRARRRGGTVTVAGRVTRRGTEPVLVATVEQLRGGRVTRRRTATLRGAQVRAGAFSLPVPVGSVRRGTTLRATVTLLDEAAELASTTKRTNVR
jgi:hypothetical protein